MGGEGSRGGHVIGHTKSGKPIYASEKDISHARRPKQAKAIEQAVMQAGGTIEGDWTGWTASRYLRIRSADGLLLDIRVSDHGVGVNRAIDEIKGKWLQISSDATPDDAAADITNWLDRTSASVHAHRQRRESAAAAAEAKAEARARKLGWAGRVNRLGRPLKANNRQTTWEAELRRMTKPVTKASGEGSRGGTVVGHTSSGHPIYASAAKPGRKAHHFYYGLAQHEMERVIDAYTLNQIRDAVKLGQQKLPTLDEMKEECSRVRIPNVAGGALIYLRPSQATELARHILKRAKAHLKQTQPVTKGRGEGSRGGNIIGHTKSGKPIYAAKHYDPKRMLGIFDHLSMYSRGDHRDAAAVHSRLSEQHKRAGNVTVAHRHAVAAEYHRNQPGYVPMVPQPKPSRLESVLRLFRSVDALEKGCGTPAKLKQCVDKVKARGCDDVNAYAVCQTSTGLKWHNKESDEINGKAKRKLKAKEIKMSKTSIAFTVPLAKAGTGEGSRGGHVIGHTKTGKPIYSNVPELGQLYGEFTASDHTDAAKLHRMVARRLRETGVKRPAEAMPKYTHSEYNRAGAEVHQEYAGGHARLARLSVAVHGGGKISRQIYDWGSPEKGLLSDMLEHKTQMATQIRKLLHADTRKAAPRADVAKAGNGIGSRGGAGSRGGNVVGYTKDGKPIYKNKIGIDHLQHLGSNHPDGKGQKFDHNNWHGPGSTTHSEALLGHLAHAHGDDKVVGAYKEAGYVKSKRAEQGFRATLQQAKKRTVKPAGGYTEAHNKHLLDQMTEANHHTARKYMSRAMQSDD